jgi:hypothetical protein
LEFLIIESKEAFYQAITWSCLTLALLALATAEFLAGSLALLSFGFVYAIGGLLIITFLFEVSRDASSKWNPTTCMSIIHGYGFTSSHQT